MLGYIIGGILVVLIAVFYEVRIGIKRTQIEHLEEKLGDILEATDNVLKMADDFKELIEDHLILIEILEENFDEDKVNELYSEKKKLRSTEDLNKLIEEIMRNEG